MPDRDIVMVGSSAGGVEALQRLACQFPKDFPAAVFVVVHLPPRTRSFLPDILSKVAVLPAAHPEDGESIQHGRIYIAPPDRHLVIERDHVHLSLGPREQHHRPCINVTFRSAAGSCGERVTGVILTGELDDGTAGLWEVKRRGGITVVQNPEEADFPSMPLNALREAGADYIVRLAETGPLLCRLAAGEGKPSKKFEVTEMEPELTDMTCPDCRGSGRCGAVA